MAEDKELISLRVARELLADVDRWRGQQPNPPTRPEAIRQMLVRMLMLNAEMRDGAPVVHNPRTG